MEIEEGKTFILKAFCELAWANGKVSQAQANYIASLAESMEIPLGLWLPELVTGLGSRPGLQNKVDLSKVPIDEVERYQVVERFLDFCLLQEELDPNQALVLADLALQLDIRAQELEEMRRRLC